MVDETGDDLGVSIDAMSDDDTKSPSESTDPTSLFEPDLGGISDQLAKSEAMAIDQGTLASDAKKQEHGRHQKFRDHINQATLAVFWTVVISLLFSIVVFTFHLITPATWHFLDEAQMSTLKTILGGAILSSAMSGYVSNRMKE